MKSYVFPPFIIFAALGSVRGNSEVMESIAPYSCCEKPSLGFDQLCENTWSTDDVLIAYSKGESRDCSSPCEKIEPGRMTLVGCPAVNATVVCTNEMNVTSEKRIYFYHQPCSGSLLAAGNQGSVGLLLAVVVGGLTVNKMIC